MDKFHRGEYCRSFNRNGTLRISGVAFSILIYSGRSLARTGPYSTKKPNLCCTSYAESPGAERCGRMIMRCRTTLESPEHSICLTSSSAQKVPLPVAQSEKSDDIQITFSSLSQNSFRSQV